MEPASEPVKFVHTEQTDDLIVSFAIADGQPWGVLSLILLRTPKFEFALPDEEKGVSVSHESFPEDDIKEMLRRIRVTSQVVTIEATRRKYQLDVSKVDRAELDSALQVLESMNFDGRFVLERG